MHYDYTRLFDLLRQKKISFAKFRREVPLTDAEEWMIRTNGRLRADTLFRICQYLCCDIREIVEVDGHLL